MLQISGAMVVAIIALQCLGDTANAKSQETVAISATVTGNDQGVGFRALVMKEAIEYNLAGTARNNTNDVVSFALQGRQKRINKAVQTIRDGTGRSSNIEVRILPADVDPKLDTFTVIDWTSTTRQITTPYTLIFTLRDTDETISKGKAKSVWHHILETTVKGDDLKKLGDNE